MSKVEKVSQGNEVKEPNFKEDDSDYRIHKPYDKYFKNVMSIAGEGFMKLIGYSIKIKQFHNTEKVNEISGELHIDNLIESDEPKMYINEFQTGPITDKDLKRFGSYQVLVFKETGLETIVNIISLDAKEDSDELYGFGEYFANDLRSDKNDLNHLKIEYGFTPHVKSLTSLNLSLYLNIMEKIIENKKKPDEYDLAILFVIPFMTDEDEKRKELIFKTNGMVSKLNITDKNLLIDIYNNQQLLAQKVLDKEEFLNFKMVSEMLSDEDLYKLDMYTKEAIKESVQKKQNEKIREEVRAELLEECKKTAEENLVKKLLEDGFKVDEVLRYTNLNKSQVIALSNAILLK